MRKSQIVHILLFNCLFLFCGTAVYGQYVIEESTPSKLLSNEDYQLGDALIKEIEDSLSIDRTDPNSIVGGYDRPFRKEFQLKKKSTEAKIHFKKCLDSLNKTESAYAVCLAKLALCEHYQIDDFSHSDSLTQGYKQSIEMINRAISIQKKVDQNELLVSLYYMGAQIASPHFYWGFQSMNAAKAEEIGEEYLYSVAEIQESNKEFKGEITSLRLIDDRSLSHLLKRIQIAMFARETDRSGIANDIREFIHQLTYQKEDIPNHQDEIEKFGQIGITTFKTLEDNGTHHQYFGSLLNDLAICMEVLDGDFKRSKPLLLQAEELMIQHDERTYYYAFQLAAIYIQQKNLIAAKAQYDLSLKDEKLSVTDTEHAWFGLAIISELQGNQNQADEIWQEHIGNHGIMNGIASYQYRFGDSYKDIIKLKALVLMKRNKASEAIRIVNESWQ
jgi:hypothetical protein